MTSAKTSDELLGFSLETPAVVDVFTEVLKRGPIARIDIARRTGLSQAAVTKAVAPLLLRGLLSAHDNMRAAQPGRPVQPISVNEDAQLAIGVTVRVDEVIGVATTMRANVLHSVHRRLASTSVESVVDAVASTVKTLEQRLGDDAAKVLGVGVAVSGDVDKEHGFVRTSPRLNWSTVPFEKLLRSRIGSSVVIDNDVRALSIAEEWFGIGVDADSFAIVTIGAGIGCGLYVNGDVIEGAYGVAGELGHSRWGPQIWCARAAGTAASRRSPPRARSSKRSGRRSTTLCSRCARRCRSPARVTRMRSQHSNVRQPSSAWPSRRWRTSSVRASSSSPGNR